MCCLNLADVHQLLPYSFGRLTAGFGYGHGLTRRTKRVAQIVYQCVEDHLGAYTNATVSRREQYRRIRGKRTRLLPASVLPAQAILLISSSAAALSELTNMALMNVELLKLGLRIRASRKMLGRNQKDFSKQCGLDRSYFGGVERGERNLTFSSLCQICSGLNCDIAAVTKGIPHVTDALK